jgi:hypothetical protein
MEKRNTTTRRYRTPDPLVPHPTDPTLVLVPLTKGHFAVISAVDAAQVGRFNWSASPGRSTTYATRKSTIEPQINSLHRLVGGLMGLSLSALVDHKNGNGLDCRRSNLRDATASQNLCNSKTWGHNTSGVKGVHWEAQTEKWRAVIHFEGRRIGLGRFVTKAEAQEAYTRAAVSVHGDFAVTARET